MTTSTITATRTRPVAAIASVAPALSVHEKIDIARGLFALLVVMAHTLELAWNMHPGVKESFPGRLGDVLTCVFSTGTYYVMGFFVLSGYCIQKSASRSLGGGRFPVGHYFAARASRILPLYYLGLLASLAVEWAIAGARPAEWPNGIDAAGFLAQVFMVPYLVQTFGSYASTWTMTHESAYYVMFGLLACLASGRRSRPAWLGLGLCFVIAAVTQVLYVTVTRNHAMYLFGIVVGLGMLWFSGALIAIYGEDLVRRAWARRLTRLWPAGLVAAIAWKTFHYSPHGIYLIPGVAFSLMLLGFLASPTVERPAGVSRWRSGVVETLGLSSYPMYLFHGPVMMLLASWMIRLGLVTDWRMTWGVLFVAGSVSGVLLGWFLERPVLAWRAVMLRRWATMPRGATTAPGVAAVRS